MVEIYTSDVMASLELGWGEGWLSPGGVEEVRTILEGVDIAGKKVLDIGVGAGGPALQLLTQFNAAHVTGIDIEESVIERARVFAETQKAGANLDLIKVTPGPLPFSDNQFDVVFSKDSFVHIADKASLFEELFRVLIPGGVCVFGDWCCSAPPYSSEMLAFFQNGMDFSMATSEEYAQDLERAGFDRISVRDRNSWFADYAKKQHADAIGPQQQRISQAVGDEVAVQITAAAARRAVIARQGHLRPTHFRATRPLST